MAKKTLNVKATSNYELSNKWGMSVLIQGRLFIRCNYKGLVNWDKASVYNLDELLLRGKVKIIS